MKKLLFGLPFILFACGDKAETSSPKRQLISESVYASGKVVAQYQYQAFALASGVVSQIIVQEGELVKKGEPILRIAQEVQQYNLENASLAATNASLGVQQGKLIEGKAKVDNALAKLQNDSLLLVRQQSLWSKKIGTKRELEQRELSLQNSRTNHLSAVESYQELKRQLKLSQQQTSNNLRIAKANSLDYTLRSKISGRVFSLQIKEGEMINPQTPIAVVGDSSNFLLELQIDEYDINRIALGLPVMVVLDSHRDHVYKARITKIKPLLNIQNKSFLVEAEFIQRPPTLYPNVSAEANILIRSKQKALVISRDYMLNDSTVLRSNGDKARVVTGLKDLQMVEILSGIDEGDVLQKPTP